MIKRNGCRRERDLLVLERFSWAVFVICRDLASRQRKTPPSAGTGMGIASPGPVGRKRIARVRFHRPLQVEDSAKKRTRNALGLTGDPQNSGAERKVF